MADITGTSGNDSLTGTAEDDRIVGEGGDDRIEGGEGNDDLDGGEGNDAIFDLAGTSSRIRAGAGNDSLFTSLRSTAQSDLVSIDAGSGNDSLTYHHTGPGRGTIDLGAGGDQMSITGLPSGGVTITLGRDPEVGAHRINFSRLGPIEGSGLITITDFGTGANSDRFNVFDLAIGNFSATGYDTRLSPFDTGLMRLMQVGGDVVLQADRLGDGTYSNFAVFKNVRLENLEDGHFFEISVGGGQSMLNLHPETVIAGTAGADGLTGTQAANRINGGDGADRIDGRAGNDILTGGSGADVFVFSRDLERELDLGDDRITDFDPATDTIDLTAHGVRFLDDIMRRAVQDGSNVVLHVNGRDSITLENVSLAQLTIRSFAGMQGATALVTEPGLPPSAPVVQATIAPSGAFSVAQGQTVYGRFGGALIDAYFPAAPVSIVNNGTIWSVAPSNGRAISGTAFTTIDNNGTIVSITDKGDSVAVELLSAFSGGLDNSGTIQALSRISAATAVLDYDFRSAIVNSGTIAARGEYAATAIARVNGGFLDNTATGRILAQGGNDLFGDQNFGGATAVYIGRQFPDPERLLVRNAGLIEADGTGTHSSAAVVLASTTGRVENSGVIRADVAIAASSTEQAPSGPITIDNLATGQIVGDIILNADPDVVRNAGTIVGYVITGAANDLVDTVAGSITGLVDLGLGDDELRGGNGNDIARGDRGSDRLFGFGGNDLLLAGFDNDELRGGTGNDGLYGEGGDDVIYTEGSDFVSGGRGADSIIAGDFGFARIAGGGGFDRLFFAAGTRTIELSSALKDGRLSGIEYVDLQASQTMIVRQGSVSGSGAASQTLYVAGASTTALVLVGGWQRGHSFTDSGIAYVRYTLDSEVVIAGNAIAVSVVAERATQASGLDAVTGLAAPVPGVIDGADLSSNIFQGDRYNPDGDFIISEDEIWVGNPVSQNTIFQGNSLDFQFVNNGLVYQDVGYGAIGFNYARQPLINNGAIIVDMVRETDFPFGVGGVSLGGGRIENNGLISVLAGDDPAIAISSGESNFLGVVNKGEITAESNNDAIGISMSNGGFVDNSGEIYVTSTESDAIGMLIAHFLNRFISYPIAEFGLINTGSIAAVAPMGQSIGLLIPVGHTRRGAYIFNSGTIEADIAIAMSVSNIGAGDSGYQIINHGLIRGLIDLAYISRPEHVETGPTDKHVINEGRIIGDVRMGGGNDIYLGALGSHEGAVFGQGGNDTLTGGVGSDRLDGGEGLDRMIGGRGDDAYWLDAVGDLVFENAGEGNDTVHAAISHYLFANVENLTLTGAANLFGVGSDAANILTGNAGENLLIAGAGNDVLRGGGARDALFGESGEDQLFGETGIDYIVAGTGNDIVDGGRDADEIYGEAGDDLLFAGEGFHTDILVGGDGNDVIRGDSGSGDFDFLYGNAGNDIFYVDTPADLVFESLGEGTDTVFADINGAGFYLYDHIENLTLLGNTPFGVGNALANVITGNAQANFLLGGAGNDILNGLGGGDVLFGEAGADTFVFARGTGGDVIGDFARGVDKIDLRAFGFTSFTQLQTAFVQNGDVGAIALGNGDLVVLHNVTMSQLAATDFIL